MKIFYSAALLILFAGVINAADPVYSLRGQPESAYNVSQSTVAVSSNTVSTDASVSGYRNTCIFNLSLGSTVYYRIDGSTNNVATVGYPILPLTFGCVEYNGEINWLLGASDTVGSVDVIKKVIRK